MASTIILSDNGASSGSAGLKETGGNDGTLLLQTTTSGGTATTALAITATQNVGIGTSSPSQKLTVSDSATSTVLSVVNTAGSGNRYSQVQFFDSATQKAQIYQNHNDGNMTIRNNTASGGITFLTNDTTYSAALDASGNFKFNSGYGSTVTAYGCRAWVNFNGTGTVAIRASGNVTSITDNGVGDYTVNFTTAMPDANYSAVITAGFGSGSRSALRATNISDMFAGSVRYNVASSNGANDDVIFQNVSIFR